MTVAELLDRMSSRELTEWMVYAGLEPFGSDVDDARNAINTASITNAVIASVGGKKQVKAEQFLLGDRTASDTDISDKLRSVFGPPPKD